MNCQTSKINNVDNPKINKKSKKKSKNSYKKFLKSIMNKRKDVSNVSQNEKDLYVAKIKQSIGGGNFKKVDKI